MSHNVCRYWSSEHEFDQCKNPILIYDVNINRILVSNNLLFAKKDFKYFVGFQNDYEKVMPLCIILPKMSVYIEEILIKLNISFLIKDNILLNEYHEIWDNISITVKRTFDSEHVYNEKYLKTKTKPYERKVNPNFRKDKMPQKFKLIGSVSKLGEIYCAQVFLEEYKYIAKEKEVSRHRHITEHLRMFSDSHESDE